MGSSLFTVRQFIEAIPDSGGIISTIAKRVGCDWQTAKKYVTKYPMIRTAYENECNRIDDMVVSTVLSAIEDGDIATAKWWLAKKRRAEFGDQLDVHTQVTTSDVVLYLPEKEKDDA